MTNVPFPLVSTPGSPTTPQTSGGRLINCYPETTSATAGMPYSYWRVPGLGVFGTVPSGVYRGGILVAGTFYGLFGSTVYSWTSAGGAGAALTNTVPGTADCAFAANQNTPPDVCIVSPGLGAFIISAGTTILTYPDVDVATPNWVVFHQSFFIFTYGSGATRASDPNSTNINALNSATAQSKPDTLYRPLPLGNGQLLLVGSNTIEVWGGTVNLTGYPFNYVATIPRGIAGPMAIAGNEDGWGKGIFFVGDDNKVSTLTTYTPTPISIPDLDNLIEDELDKSKIFVGVYVSGGHGFVIVQGPQWCWEYDTTLQTWHERRSYLKNYCRMHWPIYAFGKWLCGDTDGSNLCQISNAIRKELGNPLAMRVETGPLGAFPKMVRVNTIELYMTKGVSIATGHAPDETDGRVAISMSRDGGNSWTNPRQVPIGVQAISNLRARASIWGQAEVQGVRWRFEESAGLPFGFMGADMASDVLQ